MTFERPARPLEDAWARFATVGSKQPTLRTIAFCTTNVQTGRKAIREGKFNDPRFGTRRRITDLFCLFRKRYGLDGNIPPLDCSRFRRRHSEEGQLRLF